MTQDEEDRPEAKVLKRLATALVAMDWIKPAIDPKLGAMAFREIVPILRSVPEIMSLLVRIDSSFIPTDTIRKISGSLENLGNLRIQIEGFSITADNARALRDQLSDKIRGSYKNFLLGVAPVLSLGLVKDIDVARIKIDLQKELEDVAGKRTEESAFELRMIQNMKTEAEETLRSIQAAAAQTGVSRHAKLFSTEAAEHRRAALLWAIFTVAMALATMIWGAAALWWLTVPEHADMAEVVQQAIGKIIIFSGLSYGLLWSARNYSANRHDYIVNKHRQNSLTTFETFVNTTGGDEGTKNAVLLQATNAIFSAQSTGYSPKEPKLESTSKVIEILRGGPRPSGEHD